MDVSDEEALGLIGGHVPRVERGRLREHGHELLKQAVDAAADDCHGGQAGREPLVAEGGGPARERDSSDSEQHGQSASQWAMLFQPKATPITLRVRASGEKLSGGKGDLGIRCFVYGEPYREELHRQRIAEVAERLRLEVRALAARRSSTSRKLRLNRW